VLTAYVDAPIGPCSKICRHFEQGARRVSELSRPSAVWPWWSDLAGGPRAVWSKHCPARCLLQSLLQIFWIC